MMLGFFPFLLGVLYACSLSSDSESEMVWKSKGQMVLMRCREFLGVRDNIFCVVVMYSPGRLLSDARKGSVFSRGT